MRKKTRAQQPRKIIASVLVLYIFFMSWFIVKNSDYDNLEGITGLNTGEVRVNILPQCFIPVASEYNLVSFCGNLTNASIRSTLSSIDGKYSFILQLNESTQAFDVFDPSAASNPFDTFDADKSYFIFMNEPSIISITGSPIGDLNVSLSPEFNSPTYPYIFTTNITTYITPIAENVSFVLKWNVSNQKFTTFSPEAQYNEASNISKGEGQFIFYLASDGILRYNKTELQP